MKAMMCVVVPQSVHRLPRAPVGYIQNLELLQEAGFHPLKVIHFATMLGAEKLQLDDQFAIPAVGNKLILLLWTQIPSIT